ncbi:MAG: hypothetical protein HY459_01075 [Parcubacteria group bacterium]|nr:hypothetical protein [Parcubacteria group bacterium]
METRHPWLHLGSIKLFVSFAAVFLFFGALVSAQDQTTSTSLSEACRNAGITSYTDCEHYVDSLNREGDTTSAYQYPEPVITPSVFTLTLPAKCLEAGITLLDKCELYLRSLNTGGTAFTPLVTPLFTFTPRATFSPLIFPSPSLPVECINKSITNFEDCRRFLESERPTSLSPSATLFGTPFSSSSFAVSLPEPCREKGITSALDCRKFIESSAAFNTTSFSTVAQDEGGFPLPCKERGINSQEACALYLHSSNFPIQNGINTLSGVETGSSLPGFPGGGALPPPCTAAGITDFESCRDFMVRQNLPQECKEKGITEPEVCERFFAERFLPPECRAEGLTTPEACEQFVIQKHLPAECRDRGITNPEECSKHFEREFFPKVCTDEGATTIAECERLVFEKYGRPEGCRGVTDAECRRLIEAGEVTSDIEEKLSQELPDRCREVGAATFQACEEYFMRQNVPEECKSAGAFTREACEKVLFEKYGAPNKIDPNLLPRECQEAGATTPKACEEVMRARYFPKECTTAGLTDRASCEELLRTRHFPPECQAANVTTREACEEVMRAKYVAPACDAAGITDRTACESFMLERFAKDARCEGLSSEECRIAIEKRHLGALVAQKQAVEAHRDALLRRIGTSFKLPKGGGGQGEEDSLIAEAIPLVQEGETGVLILPSVETTVITEDESIITTFPTVALIDSDADGISDDVEERHGFDPEASDSDGDGEGDSKELQASAELAPIEEVIVANSTIEQPIASDAVSETYEVTTAETMTQTGEAAITLSGEGEPGEVATLFLYSEVPILLTVKVGGDGEWHYTFDKGLTDGEHDVYVASVDRSGTVTKRSNPLRFFVAEAQAVSASEFLAQRAVTSAPTTAETTRETGIQLLVAALFVVAFAVVALMLIWRRRHHETGSSAGTPPPI